MCKKFAPNYANLFLAEWEEKALEKCVLKPSVYWRFLDAIFMIWEHSKEEFGRINAFFRHSGSQRKQI